MIYSGNTPAIDSSIINQYFEDLRVQEIKLCEQEGYDEDGFSYLHGHLDDFINEQLTFYDYNPMRWPGLISEISKYYERVSAVKL